MKYLFILLLLTTTAIADEFDWNNPEVSIVTAELAISSGTVRVFVGTLCTHTCDISAKFSSGQKKSITFLREITNGRAALSIVDNEVVISLVYYLLGSDEGLKVNRYYQWDTNKQTLKLKRSTELYI